MIPEFPEFKKIEFTDKKEVESFTRKYPPYADFNFMNLWCWNIYDRAELSILNGNLVIKFSDYITNEPFYSFLGDNKTIETAQKLFELCRKENAPEKLRLLPEVSCKEFELTGFALLEDRSSFDYVYETESLINMQGGKFRQKRQQVQHFEDNFRHEIRSLDLSDPKIKKEILELFEHWVNDKIEKIPSYFSQNEYKAMTRFLDFQADIIAIGIYIEGKLAGVSLSEKISDEHAVGHFQKALAHNFKGLNVYLTREMSRVLKLKGIRFHNCEQDLGIPGLRESKESYAPAFHLKKYTLTKSKY